ncbi:MAG: hypothetical protein JOZ62_20580 [Acidobacteriaceae bacterium]|nr:hypothetical protein [Acidobacteriaceae bacterium]
MARAIVAIIAGLLLASCRTNREYTGYVVVRRHWVETPDGTALDFVLKHRGAMYDARCNAWDIKNNCGNMESGNAYDLTLDEKSGVLRSNDSINGRPSILLSLRGRSK